MNDQMIENLGITPEALIGNAGLSLFYPWLPGLFHRLDYMDASRKDFKDTASRVRAVFLMQYLVYLEEKEYHESELFFNRLLVTLPAHIPLPKQMELTDQEKQMAYSLLKCVKDNWEKMNTTSVSGFLTSFIVRNGQLEQQDNNWLLAVEIRPCDIILNSVPWGFKKIGYPWLEKYIQVLWN